MKYLIPILAIFLFGCAAERPKYQAGETVHMRRYDVSVKIINRSYKPNSRQIFYKVFRSDLGIDDFMPQRSLKR